MSNVSCEIIQDLLPLYCGGVCSEESRKMILDHVQTCDRCREALRVMDLPIGVPKQNREVDAAAAASRAWKKHKRKAFRTGIVLAAVLVAITAVVFFGSHYMRTSAMDDMAGLAGQLEGWSEAAHMDVRSLVQKGDYLAVSGCGDDGLWHLGIFSRDEIFPNRWRICGSLNKVKPGHLANWNYETPEGDTILVCFGAELADNICGYTFTNSGVTYTCTVDENAVLDFFFIPDAYDRGTHLEPIYRP
ncbi:MAG: zf-HC2 domain-containing protein [Oscillospiraceae bacterium]